MNFKTENIPDNTSTFVSKYISAMSITEAHVKAEFIKSSLKETPGIKLIFVTNPVDGLFDDNKNPIGQTAEHIYYLTEKTLERRKTDKNTFPGVKDTFLHIASSLGIREEFEKMSNNVTNLDNYINSIVSLFKGEARFKFGGEEVAGKDGKPNWNKAILGNYSFYKNGEIAELISTNPTNLVLTPYDLKKLPTFSETIDNVTDINNLY